MDTQTPRYHPGEHVLLTDPARGWHEVNGEVLRVITIAQQSHQSTRYLYVLRLGDDLTPVYASDEVLASAVKVAS
jgi:hypothetical protein